MLPRHTFTLAALAFSAPFMAVRDVQAQVPSPPPTGSGHPDACYSADMTEAEWAEFWKNGTYPPGIQPPGIGSAFASTPVVWTGMGSDPRLGLRGLASPASLTFSFPADGTAWGTLRRKYRTTWGVSLSAPSETSIVAAK